MAKNVSAIVSASCWIADFIGQLVEGLRNKGCTDEEIHALTAKARPAMGKIVVAVAELIRAAKNVFRLTKIGDGRTTEELVRAGRYDYANPDINSRNFPVRPGKHGVREVVLLEVDHDLTSEEVLAEAAKQDLERPDYEDALYFGGVEYPDVQLERPVVFLHEPWRGPGGHRYVLCLWSGAGYRRLDLDCFDGGWPRPYRFAFVRKQVGLGVLGS